MDLWTMGSPTPCYSPSLVLTQCAGLWSDQPWYTQQDARKIMLKGSNGQPCMINAATPWVKNKWRSAW